MVALTALSTSTAARAQDSNRAILERLALTCLAELPSQIDTFALSAPERMPFLRSALIDNWNANGRAIYSAGDSSQRASTLPILSLSIVDAGVVYSALGRRRLNREVSLALQYTLAGPDGRIILDESCIETAVDSIRRSDRGRLEDPAFAETRGEPPRAGWVRRYVEPAILVAASALGVYLFFTLRSQSADE